MIGIDVEDVARWREPGRRLADLFTPDELARAERAADPAPHLAGWWCAREAVHKALLPHVPDLGLREISVDHADDGRPVARLAHHPAWEPHVELSIAHSDTTATAMAMVVGFPQPAN